VADGTSESPSEELHEAYHNLSNHEMDIGNPAFLKWLVGDDDELDISVVDDKLDIVNRDKVKLDANRHG
jgi:hypothetical protein